MKLGPHYECKGAPMGKNGRRMVYVHVGVNEGSRSWEAIGYRCEGCGQLWLYSRYMSKQMPELLAEQRQK